MQAKGFFILLFVILTNISFLHGQIQERTLVTAMGEDVGYRVRLLNHHLDSAEWKRQVNTGKQLLATLRGAPIKLWVNFSHGHHSRLFGKIPERNISFFSNGFVLSADAGKVGQEGSTLKDLQDEILTGNIQFTPESLIILGACAVAVPNEETSIIFAQQLADITGANVIAGEHKTEPLVENEEKMVFSNIKNFIEFRSYQAPVILGNQLDIIAIIDKHLGDIQEVEMAIEPTTDKKEKAIIPKTEASKTKIVSTDILELRSRPIQHTEIPNEDKLPTKIR